MTQQHRLGEPGVRRTTLGTDGSVLDVGGGSLPKMWWILAVCAVLLGNTLISLGLLLQKRSHHTRVAVDKSDRHYCGIPATSYCFSPQWLAGLATFIAGHGCCWIGLAVGAQMVMSCLNCWCIVVTILLAPSLFNETVSLFRILAVLVLVVGCVWVTLSGPRRYEAFTVERFQLNVANEAFLVVTACTVVAAMAIMAVPRRSRSAKVSVLRLTAGAAICAWYSVLAAKCFSGLHFTTWHDGRNQLGYWQTWAAAAFFVATSVANLHLLNLALAVGDAVSVMPAYESMSLAGQIVVGGMFFQEFSALDARGHAWFWTGVALVVTGVYMVSRPEPEAEWLRWVVIGSKADDGEESLEESGEEGAQSEVDNRAEARKRATAGPAAAAA